MGQAMSTSDTFVSYDHIRCGMPWGKKQGEAEGAALREGAGRWTSNKAPQVVICLGFLRGQGQCGRGREQVISQTPAVLRVTSDETWEATGG